MTLSPEAFDQIRRLVHELCGVVIGPDKQYLVTSRLEPVLRRLGLPSYEALVQGLRTASPPGLTDALIEAITTRETSFHRDGHPFDELRRTIVPELADRLQARRRLPGSAASQARIWCAAAASGQEAYSVAMAVTDTLAHRPRPGLTGADFPILATDVSQVALATAAAGRYTEAEVARGLTPEQRARHFEPCDGGWRVRDALRRQVTFRRLNLVRTGAAASPGTFDLILCRNLLIYLDESDRRRLALGLHQALNPGGFLLIGAAESLFGVCPELICERRGATTVYRRR